MLAWTVQSFFMLSCGYLGSFAAQHSAAGEDREAGAMVWPMLLLGILATLVTVALIPAAPWIAAVYGTEAAVARDLSALLAWYLAETGPLVVAAGIAGFCAGAGRSSLVMAVSGVGCLACIVLNRWLVLGGAGLPALGVHGAGIASFSIAVGVLAFWLLWLFTGPRRQRFAVWAMRNADPVRLRRFARSALPRGGTEVLEMLAFIAFTAVIGHLGTTALAASNLAFNTYLLFMVPVVGFTQGIGIAAGRAVGAGQPELARRAVARALLIQSPYVLAAFVLFAFLPALALAPAHGTGNADTWPELLRLATPVMWALAGLTVADALQFTWRFAVQGAGDTRWPLLVLLVLSLLCMALPALIVSQTVSQADHALWWCYGILTVYGWLTAAVMGWRFARGPWPRMSLRA
jgi:MATE family multidrug resistance protein